MEVPTLTDHDTACSVPGDSHIKYAFPSHHAETSNELNSIWDPEGDGVGIRIRARGPRNHLVNDDETGLPLFMKEQGSAMRRIRLQQKLQISCSVKPVESHHYGLEVKEDSKSDATEVISVEASMIFHRI